MKHLKLFEDFAADLSQKWDDKPSKISREIFDLVEKVFPQHVLKAADSISGNGYDTMVSPPSVSNKGQSRGVNEYKTISFYYREPYGKNKIRNILVGLRKGTSGRDTGYIAVKMTLDSKHVEHAIEFAWEPVEALEKLYTEEFEKYTDEIGHIGRQYGV